MSTPSCPSGKLGAHGDLRDMALSGEGDARELLDAAQLARAGLHGDRRWIVADARTGERIANKRGPTHPLAARVPRGARRRRRRRRRRHRRPHAAAHHAPRRRAVTGDDIDAALSALLQRPVRLTPYAGPGDGRLGTPAAHHDFAAVHLVTTRRLTHLRTLEPDVDWDPRRPRPNLLLDDGEAPGPFTEERSSAASCAAARACAYPSSCPHRAASCRRARPRS